MFHEDIFNVFISSELFQAIPGSIFHSSTDFETDLKLESKELVQSCTKMILLSIDRDNSEDFFRAHLCLDGSSS
jgi:hypothetical protein